MAEFTLLVDRVSELSLAAHAEGTITRYLEQWKRFDAWCESRSIAVTLPVPVELVMLYIADWVTQTPPPAYSTINQAFSAINWAHSQVDLPPPRSVALARLKKGVRRTLKVAPTKKARPLRLTHLRTLGSFFTTPRRSQLRDACVISLRAQGMSYSMIANATMAQLVELSDTRAVLATSDGQLTFVATGSTSCPVANLQAWVSSRGGWPGTIITRVTIDDALDHRPIPRQTVPSIVSRLSRDCGEAVAIGDVMDKPFADRLVSAALCQRPAAARDMASILMLWACGLRSDELVRARMRDVAFDDRGMSLTVRTSKTDQQGHGTTKVVPRGGNAATDPVGAMEAWFQVLTAAGATDETPIFVPIDHADALVLTESDKNGVESVVRPVKPTAITDMLRRALRAAQVESVDVKAFSSHSGKRGVATELAHNGADIRQIAQVTGHKSLEVARGYVEEVEKWTTNPLRGLDM
ncbi:MAG: tyrosine-type recombinase/integrase [Acidimicrobiia bacterium]